MKKRLIKFFLNFVARRALRRFRPAVVLVTGSAGKSMAKEAIQVVLEASPRYRGAVRRTPEMAPHRLRDYIIPLTALADWAPRDFAPFTESRGIGARMRRWRVWGRIASRIFGILLYFPMRYPRILVLEYRVECAWVARDLLRFLRPTIGVLTSLGDPPPHRDSWESPEGVLREKIRALESVRSGGIVVLNHDDPSCAALKEKTRTRVMTFGFSNGADVQIVECENHFSDKGQGISFKLTHKGSVVPVVMRGAFGKAYALSAAAAACVGIVFGLHLVEISEALGTLVYPWCVGIHCIPGIKKSLLLDASYHASPASLREAMRILAECPAERKVAVLGDMVGLGAATIRAHEEAGKEIAAVARILITVGPRAKFIARAAEDAGMSPYDIVACDTAWEAGRVLQQRMERGDAVLIAGSKEMGLGRVVEEVRADQAAIV